MELQWKSWTALITKCHAVSLSCGRMHMRSFCAAPPNFSGAFRFERQIQIHCSPLPFGSSFFNADLADEMACCINEGYAGSVGMREHACFNLTESCESIANLSRPIQLALHRLFNSQFNLQFSIIVIQ